LPLYEAECSKCGYAFEWYEVLPTDETRPCPRCAGKAERLFSRYSARMFTPFVTRNILPDGRPILVESQRQLSSLCNEHKLVHLDDPKWEPRHKTPPNPHEIFGSMDLPEARAGVEGDACRQEDLPA
jgi:putative FmdB family regulatory protein